MKEKFFKTATKLLAVPSNPIAEHFFNSNIQDFDDCQFCYFNNLRSETSCRYGLGANSKFQCVDTVPIVWMEPAAYVAYQLTKEPQYEDSSS